MLERRQFITGLISLVAAPAIIRAGSLMPVKVMEPINNQDLWFRYLNEILEPMAKELVRSMEIINVVYGTYPKSDMSGIVVQKIMEQEFYRDK